MKTEPLRFAVIGARRGRTFVHSAETLGNLVKLAAICDLNESMLDEWSGTTGIKLYSDFSRVLADPEIDAVCLATPVPQHASQAIAALKAGKHVLSEVTAAHTMEECLELIAAVEASGLTYMMAENYCFMESVLQVQHMVEQGVFGDLVYASGAYIHDCRKLCFGDDGGLTWRGHLRSQRKANVYPTHSVGPVARWLGINNTDYFESTATWASRSRAMAHYAGKNHPGQSQYESRDFWMLPDTTSTCIRTEKGILVDLRVDSTSARPHQMCRYELQGTKASFSWPDGPGRPEPLIWIEGRSPADDAGIAREWEPLFKYREEFQHPLWREFGDQAAPSGHGGGDFFILREFAQAVREGRPPLIDVYDAVTWSSITPLSAESIERGSLPVKFPRFKSCQP